MNPDYQCHAYARVILYELRHYLKDRFVAAEAPAKAQMICEEVLYADREVPQQAFLEILQRLARMEEQERLAMAEYEMQRRRAPEPIEEVEHETKAPRKQKPNKAPSE